MPHENDQTLKPWELAEAEATSDVTDTDLVDGTVRALGARDVPVRPGANDTELAHAECESDLSHSEPAR
jgi:hypothetical protein